LESRLTERAKFKMERPGGLKRYGGEGPMRAENCEGSAKRVGETGKTSISHEKPAEGGGKNDGPPGIRTQEVRSSRGRG